MENHEKAKSVLSTLKKKLSGNKHFNGIEIAAAKKDGNHTDDVCVRILVNSSSASHETLGVPQKMEGVPIEIVQRDIKAL